MNQHGPVEERIAKRTIKTDDCWVWTGATNDWGYGRLQHDGRMYYVHRLVLILAGVDVPDDMAVDHLCRTRSCIRPEHLEVVTHGENTRRAWLSREACKRGHEYTAENTRIDSQGKRVCRTCARLHAQASYERKREVA